MSNIYGFDDFENLLSNILSGLPEVADEIVKEVGLEVLSEAIDNVSGEMHPNFMSRNNNRTNYQPYPVSVNTGHLKRSLKIKKLGNGKYKVFSDLDIANYGAYVHDGTSRMRPRPFLEDAVNSVIDTGKYVEIANEILQEFLGGL